MLCSGNDAAVCLAESVAGSVAEFSNLMNAKANDLGLTNSHFESPHGLDSDEHYTTAYELALLSNYALKNPTFLSIVGTKNYTVTINGYPKNLSNTNELLGNFNGVYGIKTGFTNGANRCLVTACKRGEMDIICVVLGADTKNFRTKDSIKLIEYTFKTYEYFNLKDYVTTYLSDWNSHNPDYFSIEKGTSQSLGIKLDPNLEISPLIPIPKDSISSVEASFTLNPNLQAPVHDGDHLGTLKISSKNTILAEFDLFSNTDIKKNNLFDYLLEFFKSYPHELENSVF
ncbi:MAG: D-alanyl-D-alanine carboxypeptidase [Clostridia bacterium]|nr:D-alanyl-D-alanine carboxypeptidase [Clostridia bacterium]